MSVKTGKARQQDFLKDECVISVSSSFEALDPEQISEYEEKKIIAACMCSTTVKFKPQQQESIMQVTSRALCTLDAHKDEEAEWADRHGVDEPFAVSCSEFSDAELIEELKDLRQKNALPLKLTVGKVGKEKIAEVCSLVLTENLAEEPVAEHKLKGLLAAGFKQQILHNDGTVPDVSFIGKPLCRLDNYQRRIGSICGCFYELVIYQTAAGNFVCHSTLFTRLEDYCSQYRLCRAPHEVLQCVCECDLLPELKAAGESVLADLDLSYAV
ncbi:MAG: hypothetical protein IAB19_00025 [Proteobacteria bacterium]|uniref:Uncharacterized protein n=1 Tax=Candidatus Avisuccinivibrio stercorigallinarum TaxID=2840704 RepID=A0A9D9GS66_9GAMM|nr:hypothetical protein [Candidatus Avisuccinivibrio stercorigallinarum]